MSNFFICDVRNFGDLALKELNYDGDVLVYQCKSETIFFREMKHVIPGIL